MKQLDSKAVWLFFFLHLSGLVVLAVSVGYLVFVFRGATGNDELAVGVSLYAEQIQFIFTVGVILFFVISIIISYILAKLSYKFYKYELTETGFRKESGIIYKKYVTIPYDRIQNVDIYRGIIARLLGLSDLRVQTAGSTTQKYGGAEGKLPGVSMEEAESLRDELMRRAGQHKGKGL